MNSEILVTHPGRQHSHQLARALFEFDMLAEYWTGVPSTDPADRGSLYRLISSLSPQPTLGLPSNRVQHCFVAPLVRRLTEPLLPPSLAIWWNHTAFAWFDRWCARRFPSSLDAVVCYENSAYYTFRKAEQKNVLRILDAASFHHKRQDQYYDPIESNWVHRSITKHKDEEIQLADHIMTVSELARQSYLDAGVPPRKVTSIPMGTDLSVFRSVPPENPENSEPFTFIFAGHEFLRKGVDILLEASQRLGEQSDKDHVIKFAGDLREEKFQGYETNIELLGSLDRNALARSFQSADCLVLPSRHDSFGRVVIEAMATGLPAILSDHVGAKEVLVEGKNGWVVPAENPEALAQRMQWCVENREKVVQMGNSAIATSKEYTWETYRKRVVDLLDKQILSKKSSPGDPGIKSA